MTMKNESGRSMVEMLGVLAIIGVLSIGGIAGYTMAMNRYRANEIIDAASKVAIIAMTMNNGTGGQASLADIGNPNIPCTTSIAATSDANGAQGLVQVTLNNSCSGVATVLNTIAGDRLSGADCTDNGSCTLNFGERVAANDDDDV